MQIGLRLDYLVYCRGTDQETEKEIGDIGEYVEIQPVWVQRRIYNDQFRADVVVDCTKSALGSRSLYLRPSHTIMGEL
jgi:hypothetical protein